MKTRKTTRRAVLLTGKYSHINGLRDNRDTFDWSQMTFPKLLQQLGYYTAVVGKWHLKSERTGFDTEKRTSCFAPDIQGHGLIR